MAANWITLSQSAGTGNATVTFTASYNGSSVSARSATLRFKVSGQTIDVQINQAKKPAVIDYLLVDGPYNYYVPYSGGSVTSANVRSEIVVYAHYDDHPVGQGFVDVTSAATITISPNDYTCGVNTSFDDYAQYLGTFTIEASYSGVSTSSSPSVYQNAVPETRRIVYSGTSQITLTNSQKWHYDEQYHDDMNVLANSYNSTSGTGIVVFDKDAITMPYEAFNNNTGLTAVDIPSSVSGWSESTFKDCTNLVSINGLENLAQLGNYGTSPSMNGYQFLRCSSLTHVGLPASMPTPYGAVALTYMMFSGCTNLTTLIYAGTMDQFNALSKNADWKTGSSLRYVQCSDGTIDLDPGQNDTITYYAPEQLTISDSAITPSITSHTFSNGVGTIKASGDITEINRSGFTNCSGMTAIELPDSLEAIHSYAFTSAISLTSITIPDSVTVLGTSVFWRCTGLTSVNIPTGTTTINNSIFSTCSSLTGITIPDNITCIENYAFYKCTSLTEITIPSGVTDIKGYAFANCTSLATINYAGTTSEWANINLSSSWNSGGVPAIAINCTDGIVMLVKDTIMYSAATQLNVSSNVITPSFTSHTFSNGVGTIKTSGNITAIAENGFKNCSGLTNVMLPNSITTIGQSAFENCTSLALITIPSGITSIDDYVFDNCESLTSIVIPDNVTNIGWKSFEYCSNLLEVTIPTSVTFIETYAFKDCTNLVDINYKGTIAQWNNITIESEWISTYADDAAIHCTDGDIPLWEPWP